LNYIKKSFEKRAFLPMKEGEEESAGLAFESLSDESLVPDLSSRKFEEKDDFNMVSRMVCSSTTTEHSSRQSLMIACVKRSLKGGGQR
jgi:hypothetical protein